MDIRRQLKKARLERSLTLEQIAIRTALSASVLRHLDEGRFELLPPGLYARSCVRAFASAVGLDPEATLARLEHLLPAAPNPLPALNERDRAAATRASVSFSHVSEHLRGFLGSPTMPQTAAAGTHGSLTLELADHGPVVVAPARVSDRTRLQRIGAVAIDLLVLAIVNLLVVLLVAIPSAIPVGALLRDGAWAVATLALILAAIYFLLFGGVAGSTIGRYTFSLPAPGARHPLTLPEICRRALMGR
jgi:hypothetical protein